MLVLTLLFVVNYQIDTLGAQQRAALICQETAEIYPRKAPRCCATITAVPGLTTLVALC